jgi:hypothetical protein
MNAARFIGNSEGTTTKVSARGPQSLTESTQLLFVRQKRRAGALQPSLHPIVATLTVTP